MVNARDANTDARDFSTEYALFPKKRCRCCGEVKSMGQLAKFCPFCILNCTNEGCVWSMLVPVEGES